MPLIMSDTNSSNLLIGTPVDSYISDNEDYCNKKTFKSPSSKAQKEPPCKLNLKSLDFDNNLDGWIDSTENDPLISANTFTVTKDKLELDRTKLKDVQIKILEKFYTIINNIPVSVLSKFLQFDIESYTKLNILYQRIRSKIHQIEKKLLTFDLDEELGESISNLDKAIHFSENHNDFVFEPLHGENEHIFTNCIEKDEKIKTNINKDASNNNNNSNKEELDVNYPTDYNATKFSDTSKSDNVKLKTQMTKLNEKIIPVEVKKASVFKLKVPVKATVSPEMYKKLKEMTEKSRQSKFYTNNKIKNNDRITTDLEHSLNNYQDNFEKNINNFNVSHKYHSQDLELSNCPQFDTKKENVVTVSPIYNMSSNYSQTDKIIYKQPNTENNLCDSKSVETLKNDNNECSDNIKYPHSQEMINLFRNKFKLSKFRPNQLQAINATMLQFDCFILMPTGGGKSLCYQLPALLSTGITIVVSPLKSLILDQTQKLSSLNIPAAHLSGTLTIDQTEAIYSQLSKENPILKLLYVTPEKLSVSQRLCNSLKTLYERRQLARFVIDEAHCVSQWGHDFRQDYKKLRELRRNYSTVPIMALTATATPRVRTDILCQLGLTSPKWFISSFNRPNLRYSIINKSHKNSSDEVIGLIKIKFKNDCGIIYCLSRKDCDDYARQMKMNGIKALSYHAGLTDKQRTEIQNQWISEKIKVVCATIAFGMGIDKPNVRFVIHAILPKSIEGYYQESGRAGRDSKSAECILFYNYKDMYRHKRMIETDAASNKNTQKIHIDNLKQMVSFCENTSDCRRALQLNYFGEVFNRKFCISNKETACDNCRNQGQFHNLNITEDAKALVTIVQDLTKNNRLTVLQIVEIYKGNSLTKMKDSGYDKHRFYGKGKSLAEHDIERLLHKLVIENYLEETMYVNNEITYAYLKLGSNAKILMTSSTLKLYLQIRKTIDNSSARATVSAVLLADNKALTEIQQRCYTELVQIIRGLANGLNISINSVIDLDALQIMSKQLPESEEAMLKIDRITKANYDKYGKSLLNITQKYALEKNELLKKCKSSKTSYLNKNSKDNHCIKYTKAVKGIKRKRATRKCSSKTKKYKYSESCRE
ncbi:PREDICTED: Bloom syndrome protein homolog [Ceratosolen solmsi marchali]|uniref:RecQ-like DNA helicase BLM n=1 Tax=Ceratosolen solmsi marchali TaxID=326594 RepID=A0AAJ6YWS3_9HYME|nr:PREDICTED: Bloom syndrome protein homolog [Ceratosolen solmsi marchali]